MLYYKPEKLCPAHWYDL